MGMLPMDPIQYNRGFAKPEYDNNGSPLFRTEDYLASLVLAVSPDPKPANEASGYLQAAADRRNPFTHGRLSDV
jgi:hypothetical protein